MLDLVCVCTLVGFFYFLSLFLINIIMLQIYCRGQPPDYVLRDAKNSSKFFKCVGSLQNIESSDSSKNGRSLYQALTVEEYETVSLVCYCFCCWVFVQNEQFGISSIYFFLFLIPFLNIT